MAEVVTDAQLQALRARLVSGVKSVQYNDRTVENQSVSQMTEALEYLESKNAAAAASVGKRRRGHSLAKFV